MTEFTAYNAGTHPIIKAEDDYNNILDHAFEKSANYVIRYDGTNVEAVDCSTGKIAYTHAGTDIADVLQDCVDAVSNSGAEGGIIRIKKSPSPTGYTIPGRYTVNYDYTWTVQVTVPEGISIIGENIIIKHTTLDNYALKYYVIGSGGDPYYQKQYVQVIEGMFFVGLDTNASSGAIYVDGTHQITLIRQIMTTELKYGIKLEGACYRVKVSDCMLEGTSIASSIGIQVLVDGGAYPNASKICDNDISGFDTGIDFNGSYGFPITNNYLETNTIAIDNQTANGPPNICNNFIQCQASDKGVSATKRTIFVGNYVELSNSASGCYAAAEAIWSICGNIFYAAGTAGKAIDATSFIISGIISGNAIQSTSTSYAIYGLITRCNVTGNYLWGNTPFYLTGTDSEIADNYIYNTTTGMTITGNTNNVHGNFWKSCTTDLDLGGSDNWVHDNYFTGTTKITISAGTHKIKFNRGYLTENGGNSTGTGAQQTIAHGLSATPAADDILLSEYTTGGALAYQSAVPDATNIYVTATNTKTWIWKIIPD